MKMSYTKTIEINVDMAELIDSIFNGGASLYEALDEQGIEESILDDIFEEAPAVIEKLKYEMAKELLSETLGGK